jgi:hypothetical protein
MTAPVTAIRIPFHHLRSSLFSVRPATPPPILIDGELASFELQPPVAPDILMASQSDFTMTTTVPLSMSDQRVFWHIWSLAADGGWAQISFSAVARDLGDDSNAGIAAVKKSIDRCSRAIVQINTSARFYRHGLLGISGEHGSSTFNARVDPDLLRQIRDEDLMVMSIAVNENIRLGARAPFRRWLILYLSTHKSPRPIPIAELRRLCGSSNDLKSFRQNLKKICLQMTAAGIAANVKKSSFYWSRVPLSPAPPAPPVATTAAVAEAAAAPDSDILPKGVNKNDVKFAECMLDELRHNFPQLRQPNIASWAKEISLMRRRDGRTLNEAWAVFIWTTQDTFWCRNILSPESLRRQYDRLTLDKEKPVKAAGGGYVSQADINKYVPGKVVT